MMALSWDTHMQELRHDRASMGSTHMQYGQLGHDGISLGQTHNRVSGALMTKPGPHTHKSWALQ